MRASFLAVAIALALVSFSPDRVLAQGAEKEERLKNVCMQCHLDSDDERLTPPAKAMLAEEEGKLVDAHARVGISCQDCHGGDATNEESAKNAERGYIGKPAPAIVPDLCGRCHSDIERMRAFNPKLPTDQLHLYQTSGHGKRLKAGDEKVATCVSCHGAHGIRQAKDPASPVFPSKIPQTCGTCHANAEYMNGRKIPTNQLDSYKKSKHAKLLLEEGDISAPNCATCHGNHGASPPGVAAVHNICGTCHAQQDEYFAKSTHAKAFADQKLPGCVTCHGNHEIATPTDEMMNNKPGSSCVTCHAVGDSCYLAVDRMSGAMAKLSADLAETEALLADGERLGMGVEKAKFSLNEVADHFTKARVKVHQFKAEIVEEEIKAGAEVVAKAKDAGKKALEEWEFRRVGLGVSLVLILLTILALIAKIRSIESEA